jgi:hypothetical protein
VGVVSEAMSRGIIMMIVRCLLVTIMAFQGSAFAATQDAVRGAHEGSLDELRGKTGWIPLGDVTGDQTQWATGADPNTEYNTGAFEFVDKATDRRKPVLPRPSDRIRLTTRIRIFILDFASTGERRALDDPSSVHRSATGSELTDIILPKGSIVEVREIRLSPARGGIRTVWVRIVPAKSNIQ